MGITRIAIVGMGLVALAAGCGLAAGDNSDARSELRVDPAATAEVFAELAASTERVDAWRPKTLAGALPNQRLQQQRGTRPASLAVVAGRVTAAEIGAASYNLTIPTHCHPSRCPSTRPRDTLRYIGCVWTSRMPWA